MSQTTYLVMEACHGDLRQLIDQRKLEREELRGLGRMIVKPLEYLHTSKILNDEQKDIIIHRCADTEIMIYLLPFLKVCPFLET